MQGSGGVGRRIPAWTALLAAAACCLALAAPATGASLQTVGNYDQPIYVTSDPNDWTRLFVVERPGKIELTTPAGTTTFLDQTAITGLSGERGLLSMAFAPDFATSHLFYVFYASDVDGSLHVDELRANGDTAVPSSRRSVLTIQHSNAGNHNGGQLQFGPDGYLYISTGDGGGGGDPLENAQDPDTLLGKILRIDPRQNGLAPYTVPPDNPFVGHSGADEVWSLGLRNPWRFSFDRENHALVIGDVGQSAWEEVDYRPQAAGGGKESNFGWDCREGRHDFETTGCGNLTLTEPMFEYPHTNGVCAITGGYVVRDPGIPELLGRYLYADLCAGQVRSLRPGLPDASDDRSEGLSVVQPATFGEDSCGRVYVASLSGGQVYRFVGAAPTNCGPPPQPALTGTDPESPANENNPKVTGTAQLGTTVSLYTDPNCGGSPVATGDPPQLGSV